MIGDDMQVLLNQKYDVIARTCVDAILKKKKNFANLLVAITGDSGSGKSYYSELIRAKLDNLQQSYLYINADDFLIARKDREPMKHQKYDKGEFAGKTRREILENMFRLEEFRAVLINLSQGKAVSYKPYRRDTGLISDSEIKISPSSIVIVDSSMLLEFMHCIIRVDVAIETIIDRKIKRDADIRSPKQIEEMHRKVQGYYWNRKKPKIADVIIDNNDFSNPTVQICNPN